MRILLLAGYDWMKSSEFFGLTAFRGCNGSDRVVVGSVKRGKVAAQDCPKANEPTKQTQEP